MLEEFHMINGEEMTKTHHFAFLNEKQLPSLAFNNNRREVTTHPNTQLPDGNPHTPYEINTLPKKDLHP